MGQTERLPRTILLLHTAESADALESPSAAGHVSIKLYAFEDSGGGK